MTKIVIDRKEIELTTIPATVSDRALPVFYKSSEPPYASEFDHLYLAGDPVASPGLTQAEACVAETVLANVRANIDHDATIEQVAHILAMLRAEVGYDANSPLSIARALMSKKIVASIIRCRTAAELTAAAAIHGPCVATIHVGANFYPYVNGRPGLFTTSIGFLPLTVWAATADRELRVRSRESGEFISIKNATFNQTVEDAFCFVFPTSHVPSKPVEASKLEHKPEPVPEVPIEPKLEESKPAEPGDGPPAAAPAQEVEEAAPMSAEPGTVKATDQPETPAAEPQPPAEPAAPKPVHRVKNRRG